MIEKAKDSLGLAIQNDPLYVQSVRDDLAVGNLAGIQYAEAKAARDQFELRLAKLEEDHQKLQLFYSSLQKDVLNLKESVEDYNIVRHRFISFFKRDVLLTATPNDFALIRKGSNLVHGGDAKRDADLYETGGRQDYGVYEMLYGFHPSVVKSIRKFLVKLQ